MLLLMLLLLRTEERGFQGFGELEPNGKFENLIARSPNYSQQHKP
jgi:hypothetical protein